MVEFGSVTLFGALPFAVRSQAGTCRAIDWMFFALGPLTPGAAGMLEPTCRFWKGRRSARSKMAPMST